MRDAQQLWAAARGTPSLTPVRTSSTSAIALTAVADVAVGQAMGSQGLWSASLAGGSAPTLPEQARRGVLPDGQGGDQLAWQVQAPGEVRSSLMISRFSGGRFGDAQARVTGRDIYVTSWINRCWLVVREPRGLFAHDACRQGPSEVRLLTGTQAERIFDPARFGLGPGTIVLALTEGEPLQGPLRLYVLRAPDSSEPR